MALCSTRSDMEPRADRAMETDANGNTPANNGRPERSCRFGVKRPLPDPAPPKTASKKEYLKQRRAELKLDADTYAAHRKAETARIRKFRAEQTQEQIDRNKVLQRERQKKYSQLDIQAEKIFFGARHGKSECDALGGTVKSLASTLVASNTDIVISDAKTLFEECSSRFSTTQLGECGNIHKSRTFFLVESSEIVRKEHADLKAIPQTRMLHHIKKVGPNVIATRKLACFCDSCLNDCGECENAEWVGKWEYVKFAEKDVYENDDDSAASTSEKCGDENYRDIKVGAFHSIMWNGKDYIAQIVGIDGNWVQVNFMKWHVGKLCWGQEDISWEERDAVGCEVELKLDESSSTQRKQVFTYSYKMPN